MISMYLYPPVKALLGTGCEKLASVGAIGYGDYPTFMEKKGMEYADSRRHLYKIRHEKDRHERGTAGYYADKLLW